MVEKETTVKNKTGLHARPASKLVNEASSYQSEVRIVYKDKKINAKSIMGLMSLGIDQGSKIIIQAEGEDENNAVSELIELIESGFGEE